LIKLFTHTDLDGVGCAVLAKLAFKDEVDIEYCNYNEINEKVLEYINQNDNKIPIYITDISVKEELAKLLDKRGNVQLLDHHPTALELNKYSWCRVMVEDLSGLKTSGTKMFYHWLGMNGCFSDELENNKLLNRFAELVRDYDTWRWAELGDEGIICKQVNDLLYLYGREKFISWCVSKICCSDSFNLDDTDKLLFDIKQKEIDDYVEEKDKQLFTSPMCGLIVGFVFADKYFSELGNRLCKMHPEIDFVAMIDMDGTVSYRTIREDLDLGQRVAKQFGGGGHPKAAGSQFSKEVMLKTVEHIFYE
jgi:oligoribonuclease NrnB/cAMP/cGMP phosphodiesterase (DHH superfamily)